MTFKSVTHNAGINKAFSISSSEMNVKLISCRHGHINSTFQTMTMQQQHNNNNFLFHSYKGNINHQIIIFLFVNSNVALCRGFPACLAFHG